MGEMQIGLDILLGAASGIIGAIGAYVKLKSRLDLEGAKNQEQEKEINDIKERKKEMNIAIHKRIDEQKAELSVLNEKVSSGQSKLETAMAQMELRIVKEFQTSVKELIKEFKSK
jgi:hypothetical protein